MMEAKLEGDKEVTRGLAKMLDSIKPNMRDTLEEISMETANIMRSEIPNRSGSLASSIDYEIDESGDFMESKIGPNDSSFDGRPVGRATELGRQPGGGFPNWFEISERYGVSTAVAFSMAKTIMERGTRPGLQYVSKTFGHVASLFMRNGVQAIYNIANKF